MKRSGTIYLYYKTGELVTGRQYVGTKERGKIIAYWQMIYAAAFDNTFLQIAPEVNIESINPEDGTNKRNSPQINGQHFQIN